MSPRKRSTAYVPLVGAVLLALSACGGSSSPSTPTPPPTTQNASPGGLWQGNFTTTAGDKIAGSVIVGETGQFYAQVKDPVTLCADLMTGTLSVSGNDVSGDVTISIVNEYSGQPGGACAYGDGSTTGNGSVTGTVSARSTLTLTPKLQTAKGTALTANTLDLAYAASLYDTPAKLSSVAGVYSVLGGFTMSVSTGGALSTNDPTTGCVLTGTLSVIDASYDAYSATGTYTGCQGGTATLNGTSATGTFSAVGPPGTLFGGFTIGAAGDRSILAGQAVTLNAPSNLSYQGDTALVLGESASLTASYIASLQSFSVSPALPAGLTLNPISGAISGTPTAVSPPTAYTVTVQNAAGSETVKLTIGVAEIGATASQVGSSGEVDAVVSAYSQYGIDRVSASLNGQSLGTLTAANACTYPGGSPIVTCNGAWYVFPVNGLASGTYTLTALVTDGKGTIDTVTENIVINNPPVVSASPADGAIIYGTLALSGSVATDKSGVGITTSATFNGVQILAPTNTTSFIVNYSLSGLIPGDYPLVITARDATGAESDVTEQITVASSANLVYSPIATIGQGGSLLAVDPTSFAYSVGAGLNTPVAYYSQSGTSTPVALEGISSSFGPLDWAINSGVVYATGNAGDRAGATASVYQWSTAGAVTNLSNAAHSAGFSDTLFSVHAGWLLWGSTTVSGITALQLYSPATATGRSIGLPSGANYFNQGDFYVGNAGVVAFYSAEVGSSPMFSSSVYEWSQAGGASTLIYSGGQNAQVRADGTRVVWETTVAGSNCVEGQLCQLTAFDIASSTAQTISSDLAFPFFSLSDGVLAWAESASSGALDIKESPGIAAPIQTVTQAAPQGFVEYVAFGAGDGYVLYLDGNNKLYVWNTSTNSSRLLLDAAPNAAMISGKTVYFTNGGTQSALYRLVLP